MGLRTRLARAKTLLWLDAVLERHDLHQIAQLAAQANIDLIMVRQLHATLNQTAECIRVLQEETRSTSMIVGAVGSTAVAELVNPDAFIVAHSFHPLQAHRFGLVGAICRTRLEFSIALAHDQVDFIIVTQPLAPAAVAVAPPQLVDSKPWFVEVDCIAQGKDSIEQGARSLAIDLDYRSGYLDREHCDDAQLSQYSAMLVSLWQHDMTAVSLAALRLS